MDLSKDIEKIAAFEEKALFLFQKKTYDEACIDYKAEAADLIQKMKEADFDAEAAADQFVAYYQTQSEHLKGLKALQRNKLFYNHNMYLVCYILPYFVELDGEYKAFAKLLAQKWNAAFKRSNIKAASFAEISAGFVTRLFGTIVSES